ncbi:MAG: cell division protein FtsL [Cycloclasticus sp.]|mgnify:FL=1|jgi:cell division protein FtsL|tara:strand:- start:97506 stop:97784 length:279 start_codon:yes stop_codon:yes gene_type:complete
MLEYSLARAILLLATLTLLSALTVVYVKYDLRLNFNRLQQEFREQDRLDVEWSRLQLEQNTWSSSNRIEKLARTKLNLQAPIPEQIVYVIVK